MKRGMTPPRMYRSTKLGSASTLRFIGPRLESFETELAPSGLRGKNGPTRRGGAPEEES